MLVVAVVALVLVCRRHSRYEMDCMYSVQLPSGPGVVAAPLHPSVDESHVQHTSNVSLSLSLSISFSLPLPPLPSVSRVPTTDDPLVAGRWSLIRPVVWTPS